MKFLKLALIQVAFFVNVNFILLGGDPLLSVKLLRPIGRVPRTKFPFRIKRLTLVPVF